MAAGAEVLAVVSVAVLVGLRPHGDVHNAIALFSSFTAGTATLMARSRVRYEEGELRPVA